MAGMSLLALGLGITTLAIAEGSKDAGRTTPTWSDTSARRPTGYAPDPTPIRSSNQWLLTFRYRRGKVDMVSARPVRLRRAVSTPRRIGRYAVELLSGPTVIERLRFDFPLIGAEELAGKARPYNAPPTFATKATVTHRVMMPDTSRASRARLVDRATGQSFMIPWPPNRPVAAKGKGPPDAGKDASADARGDAAKEGGPEAGRDAAPTDARPDVIKRRDAAIPEAAPLDGGTPR
jgi:hypothetical protein